MFQLEIKQKEFWNAVRSEFIYVDHDYHLELEHSLVSLTKWESKWKKPFLTSISSGSYEEKIDYLRCMTMTKGIPYDVYYAVPMEDIHKVFNYINDPQTATTIYDFRPQTPGKKEIPTSEVLYCRMIQYGIPFECQKWHLNKLITLLRLCNIHQTSQNQTMGLNSIYAQNKALNDMRRAAWHTKG